MKILITGTAGFIGFNLAKKLIFKKSVKKIYGLDNINDYYSVKLKKLRLKFLNKNKKFFFRKIDLKNNKQLEIFFRKNKFDIVYHFAAQAGVRYSIKNPRKYLESNIIGFFNLLENCRKFKIKKIIYASSSSVYGNMSKFPLKESYDSTPINFYGLSKKDNEDMADIYSKYYDMKLIGLRFFTVFGEWGRPDMVLFKILNAIMNNKTFYLNNRGNHLRDFTYINDAVRFIELIKFNKEKHKIFNICSNKPIHLQNLLKMINKIITLPRIIKIKFQKADVLKTHGDNKKIIESTKIKKITDFNQALKNTISWYINNFKKFN
jgi:UDP-glucuronate 4-epimerase